MINKRLINLMGGAKKFIFFHLLLQLINLSLNVAAILLIASIIEKARFNSNDLKYELLKTSALISSIIILRYFLSVLTAKASFRASGKVKQILREKIYSKLLSFGSSYRKIFPTSEIVQISTEGVDQLEIYFEKYLPQLFYSVVAPVLLFLILSTISFKASSQYSFSRLYHGDYGKRNQGNAYQ